MSIGANTSDSSQRPVFTSTGSSYITRDTGYNGIDKPPGMFLQPFIDQDPLSRALFGTREKMGGQKLVLDPSIRAAEETSMSEIGKAYGDYGGQLSQLRQSAYGSLPDYIQSITNPLKQQQTAQMGGLQRGLGQRGLTGSSFYGQAIGGLGAEQQRSLQDATALATMQGAQGIAGLSAQEAEAAKAIADYRNMIAQQRAARDIGILTNLGSQSSSFGFNVGFGKGGGGSGGGGSGGSR